MTLLSNPLFQSLADNLAEEFEAICDFDPGDELRSSVHSFLDRHDFSFPEVFLYELRDAIFAPKTRSASGVDHITVPALRILWTHQRFALLRLVNSCLQNFPEYFKLALIHPIPKGSAAQNFRPTSLLSQLAKVVERVACYKIESSDFLLAQNQFGCRNSVSVDNVVNMFYHKSMLKDHQVGLTLFFDLKKAFDRTSIVHVAANLIRDHSPAWIVHFLYQWGSHRRFLFRCRNCFSAEHSAAGGLPQGSPLSPLAFKLAFCPPDVLEDDTDDFLFVNDYAIIVRSHDCRSLQQKAQTILDRFWEYSVLTGIQFDRGKSVAMPITPESKVPLTFGPLEFRQVSEYKYLGFWFQTRCHFRYSGYSTEKQEETEFLEYKRRLGWLKLVSFGRGGGSIDLLRQLYISLLRSKMEFAILLKAESRFMQMLGSIQLRAMRIISGGMKSCPNSSLYHFLDLPTLEQVRISKGFHLLAQLWEGQIPEFLDFYESFTATADLDDHYHESPFSAVAYAEGVIYRQHGPVLMGKIAVAREHHHLFQAAFSTDVTPREDIQRAKWKPTPVSDVPKRLFTYFSDGGYLHSLRLGALACVSPLSTWCTSFTPCSSSTHAEYEAFSWSTSLAVSELPPNSSVCFVTDSAAIVAGFPQ